MKILFKFYHFLGSIYFAITLITLTAAFVAAGTFLEARSESHLFSASLTYQNPLFLALIWAFFINILISALRRWPFQFKHVPFLITHLGLLMLLSGVIIKSYFGTQGSLNLIEGGSSRRIFLSNTYALHVEKKDPVNHQKKTQDYPFDQLAKQKIKFDDVEIRLVDYSRHSHERKQTWIKDHQAVISGLRPIPLQAFQNEKVPSSINQIHFHHENSTPWKILALSTHQVGEAAKQAYLQDLTVKISDSKTGEVFLKIPLLEAFDNFVDIGNYKLTFSLDWNFSSLNGLDNPILQVQLNQEKMAIALSGTDSLLNTNLSSSHRGKLPLTIDLSREPIFLLVQDDHEDDYLFFFNPYGEIHYTFFKHDSLQSLVAYDEGFGGYAAQIIFPFEDYPASRHDKEQAELFRLAVQLRESLEKKSRIIPSPCPFKKSSRCQSARFRRNLGQFFTSLAFFFSTFIQSGASFSTCGLEQYAQARAVCLRMALSSAGRNGRPNA